MDKREILGLSADIGQAIIKCGGEIHRAKDTVERINFAYGNAVSTFAIPSLLIVWCGSKTEIRKINNEDTNLAQLARLNALSRRLCSEKNNEINITEKPLYSKFTEKTAVCIATASFCLYFGGNITDALFSAVIGMVITYFNYKKISFPVFSSNLIDSFVAGILSFLPYIAGIESNPGKIMVGTIMLLVPGLTVVNAVRDMMNGDLIAGLIELFNAIMSALAIAIGFAGAVILFTKI